MPSLRSVCARASEIELRCSVMPKSHFPIRAMESHINKLHKYFLYKREGERSLTVQWNLTEALFMCVTECLHCPLLPSLQMGRKLGLWRLWTCPTTCLLWRTCAGSAPRAVWPGSRASRDEWVQGWTEKVEGMGRRRWLCGMLTSEAGALASLCFQSRPPYFLSCLLFATASE